MQFWSIFVASFLGTLSAFLLEAYRRYRQRSDQQFEAVLAAEAVLLAQRNSLLSFKRQSDGRNPFDNLKHILVGYSKQCIDFSSLAFIGAGDDPQLIIELDISQESFRVALNAVEVRNKLLDDFFSNPSTRIEAFDEATGVVTAVGNPVLSRNLGQANEIAFATLNRAVEVNKQAFDRLYRFAMRRFPREKKMPYAIEVNK